MHSRLGSGSLDCYEQVGWDKGPGSLRLEAVEGSEPTRRVTGGRQRSRSRGERPRKSVRVTSVRHMHTTVRHMQQQSGDEGTGGG